MKEKQRKVKRIIERASGDLARIVADTDLPMNTRIKAARKIVDGGNFDDLRTIERDKTLPNDLRLEATRKLKKGRRTKMDWTRDEIYTGC